MSVRRTKYRNVPTIYRGWRFDSKAEARRCADLDALIKAKEIRWYLRQPRFRLGCPENVYVADFLVIGNHGDVWVEDVKGTRTPKFNRDIKLWSSYGPFPLHVVSGKKLDVIEGGAQQETP